MSIPSSSRHAMADSVTQRVIASTSQDVSGSKQSKDFSVAVDGQAPTSGSLESVADFVLDGEAARVLGSASVQMVSWLS